jgi:hypothetical protein
MTRQEWLAQARAYLPSELLEQEPETPTVVVAEVVEAEVVEEPTRATQAAPTLPKVPTVVHVPATSSKPKRSALARAGRFARRAMSAPSGDELEERLYGSERIERHALEATERIIDRGMDVLEARKVPRLRARGSRFGRKGGSR